MDDPNKYNKLKFDIMAIKKYIANRYDVESNFAVDSLLGEMNDLLLGIEHGQLFMPRKGLKLGATWSATDGAYDDDAKLKKMIYQIQDDVYSVKKHITVLEKRKLFSHKKNQNINWLFPNLDCKIGKIQCMNFRDEDMLDIKFPNGYVIDLGLLKNDSVYVITIIKDDNWTNIIEEHSIKLRSKVEENLQALIYKYENM